MNQRFWIVGVMFLLAIGCTHQQTRFQSEEENERDKDLAIKTIGDVTSFDGANSVPVMGVGLVVGLDGTGGGAPPGGARSMLESHLLRQNLEQSQIKALLSHNTTSLVLVTGSIPPGARKGEAFDVEISLPPQSKTTSLRGGILKECLLYNYDSTRNLDPGFKDDRLLLGSPIGRAEGPLLVGLGDGDESAKLRAGRIWGGGRCTMPDRTFSLVLNADQQFARMAQAVADRINETFHGPMAGGMNNLASTTKSRTVVSLRLAPQYQHNQQRFLRVVRLIPLREKLDDLRNDRLTGTGGANLPVGTGSKYRRRLQEDLLDPSHTVTAALRLESLGADSIPILKKGLASEHVLVRFTSAEALAYLGSTACGEELAKLVVDQPALRAFCLTALASLDEAVSHVKLRELLATSSPETRYGAFRALRALDEHEIAIQGEMLNESFWMHRVVPNSPALVHISSSRRAEIVLFGAEPSLMPPFSLLAGEYTITAGADDDHCTLSRFSVRHGSARKQCSLRLEEVVRTLAEMGALYPDAVELVRQADHCRCLSCRVAVDALPQGTSVYDLAKAGTTDPQLLSTDSEILDARADFGATPTLFEKGSGKRKRSDIEKDEEAALRDRKPAERSSKSSE